MYSRYTGYQPFVPMNNRLSAQLEEEAVYPEPIIEEPSPPPEATAPLPAAAAAAATAALPQKNILESLLGGGHRSNRRSGGYNSGGLGSLGNLGSLGGITDLLRSGGGGITKILKNFSIDWDAGDILLVLILIFMSLESDDDEILILLGLILVMGL